MFNKSKTIQTMKKRQKYRTPGVLEKIPVCPESPILAGSIVERTAVKTTVIKILIFVIIELAKSTSHYFHILEKKNVIQSIKIFQIIYIIKQLINLRNVFLIVNSVLKIMK